MAGWLEAKPIVPPYESQFKYAEFFVADAIKDPIKIPARK